MPFYSLTSSEQSQEGRLLSYLYYRTNLLELIDRVDRYGYPHNGGQHTLEMRVSRPDLQAFLDLIIEVYGEHRIMATEAHAFVAMARRRVDAVDGALALAARRLPVPIYSDRNLFDAADRHPNR